MRRAFFETLTEIACQDERIVLLTGDLGFMAVEGFQDRHPSRFFNVGVAEQNMVGMATGMAKAGMIPFCYSIIPFVLLRPYEFIRNGPVMHRLPVRIVGVGAGYDYGNNGFTHHGTEDLAVARVLPGMVVLAPADSAQMRSMLRQTWAQPGPAYFRIGRDDRPVMPGLDGAFDADRVALCRAGDAVLILTLSSIAPDVAVAASLLAEDGIESTVGVVGQLSPPPRDHLVELLSSFRLVVTVENHSIDGGIGSVIAEILAEENLNCRLVRCGFRIQLDGRTGRTAYLNQRQGLSPEALAASIARAHRGPL
ncbi:MAG: transketolase C-terminal domain-containing protein [Azospirillaceae bacterium]|nr:transketolase C-terminal domain-containing protein [Azospirillaceae bacterium]